jgi:hypothetical protein
MVQNVLRLSINTIVDNNNRKHNYTNGYILMENIDIRTGKIVKTKKKIRHKINPLQYKQSYLAWSILTMMYLKIFLIYPKTLGLLKRNINQIE